MDLERWAEMSMPISPAAAADVPVSTACFKSCSPMSSRPDRSRTLSQQVSARG
jgi:hypothetical protein